MLWMDLKYLTGEHVATSEKMLLANFVKKWAKIPVGWHAYGAATWWMDLKYVAGQKNYNDSSLQL